MRRQPSAAWYIVPVVIAFGAMALAGFGLGAQVRELLDEVEDVDPTATVSLDSGDTRTLYKRIERPFGAVRSSCEVSPDSSPLEQVDSDVEFSLGDERWVALFTFEAPAEGQYTFSCSGGAWGLGPGFGVDADTTATTLVEWSAQFVVRLVPGLLLGAVIAGVIAWSRRPAI